MKRTIYRPLTAIAVAGTLLLAGCGSEEAEFDSDGTAQGQPAKNDDATDDQDESSGEVTGATFPDPDDVIAEEVFSIPGEEDKEFRFGISEIVVTNETMELRLVITGEENIDDERFWDLISSNRTGDSGVNIRLIDRENLKSYEHLRSDSGSQYQTSDSGRINTGESLGFQAFYAAPEDDIDVVDVDIGSEFPIFEDVPLTFEN